MAIPAIITVSESKKLFDQPDERKVHLTPVPSLGGLGIFAGIILTILLAVPFSQAPEFQYFIAASMVIFFLGMKDDIIVLTPIKKLVGQCVAAFLIMFKGNIMIKSMHGFLGVQELPEVMSLALTFFTIIVIVNSFNLIDGVDGLAGSLGLLTALVFGAYFFYVGQMPYSLLAFITAGSLLGFLIFNHSPARIFMGDTGSLLLGLINAILVIRFITYADTDPQMPIVSSPAVGFAILMVPLFDTLRVFSIRILNRRSPFSPDRNHVHHLLLDLGLSHSHVTYTCVAANILFIAVAFFGREMGPTFLLLTLIAIAASAIGVLIHNLRQRNNKSDHELTDGQPTIHAQQVLSFRKKKMVLPEDN
jgi:UDP-N-acetylmuramyl pentapeptide phosphotransferase/UDP-N-acetylglucosamine-1-phosphate transferase